MPGSTWFLWENVAHKYSLVILFTLPGILITPGLGTDELYLLSLTTYRRQAVYIFLNRGIDPLEAIRASSKITYGKKWAIFWEASCWVSLCMLAALFSLLFLAGPCRPWLSSWDLSRLLPLFRSLGPAAHIYGTWSQELEAA
ncbi:MAG: hypothetical protein E2O77_02070 [Caldithrix sp.]|nr:MAG: hypothetical protein E2O77_02070 [Caldithrix sp.]